MTEDPSNTYLHNILSNTSQDLSTNSRSLFMNFMIDFLSRSNINENLSMLPLANYYSNAQQSNFSRINELLNRTLLERKVYKKVLSSKGEEQLKKIKYENSKFEMKECAITQDKFEEGQIVIQLPCSHNI